MTDDNKPASRNKLEELIFIRIPHVLVGMLFLVAAAINIINVVARYVFAAPLFWAEEVLVFIVVWTVFLAAGMITYRGAHLTMDLIYALLPRTAKRIVNALVWLTLVCSALFTMVQAGKIVGLHYRTGGVTAATEIPLVIPHSALVFGFGFIALAAIVRVRSYLTGKFE